MKFTRWTCPNDCTHNSVIIPGGLGARWEIKCPACGEVLTSPECVRWNSPCVHCGKCADLERMDMFDRYLNDLRATLELKQKAIREKESAARIEELAKECEEKEEAFFKFRHEWKEHREGLTSTGGM